MFEVDKNNWYEKALHPEEDGKQIVTEFWKITLMGAPETIRILKVYHSADKTFSKYLFTFSCNSKYLYFIGTINMLKFKHLSCFSELNI